MSTPLPLPDFIDRDPEVIRSEIFAAFEALTGRTLQPAQVESLLLEILAAEETRVRIAIQEAAQLNLVAFSRFPMLDFLGELVGAVRLPAAAAATTMRFTLAAVQPGSVVVPAGTRVQPPGGGATFATEAALEIPAGELTGDVVARAEVAGTAANGYAVGAITVLLDPVAGVATVTNLDISAGGAETEDDDSYRERIRQAPNQFSVAGSAAAYRFHALSADPSIVDVGISSPAAGVVRVHVLTETGPATQPILDAVEAVVSGETVRPLTDTVEVVAATEVPFTLEATVRLLEGADAVATLAAVEAAAEAYAADRRAGLGRDIVPSQIVAALGAVAGVYEVTLTTPVYREVLASEWANCTTITITQGATAEG